VPLRTRLVLILVVLVTLALAGIETLTFVTIRSSLIKTVDDQMRSSVQPWELYFTDLSRGGDSPSQILSESVEPNTWAALYLPNGRLVPFPQGNPDTRCQSCQETPRLPAGYVQQVADTPGQPGDITVGGIRGADRYRLLGRVVTSVTGQSFVLVVAYPLTVQDGTLARVLFLELLIGGCILVALAALSWFFVRLGLRPLEEMASTATEIAAGDLTKRVEVTDGRTEVGQLGLALNQMLTQIENAFRSKQASEDQLRRFIADASHELRTPLTSIRGYAELFKSGIADRPEDLATALRRIESESSRMAGLVDDLLLLARLDQGRPLRSDPVDLTQLASDAVQDARVVDPTRDFHLIAAGPCYVTGDEQRLRQVLGNLVANALSYTPVGSPIEVAVHMDSTLVPGGSVPSKAWLARPAGPRGTVPQSARPEPPGGVGSGLPAGYEARASGSLSEARSYRPLGPTDLVAGRPAPEGSHWNGPPSVPAAGPPGGPSGSEPYVSAAAPASPWQGARAAIAVIDHGPGIPPANLPHVFERFWRADPSRMRASGGNGLGLSIVSAVVAAHRGRVTINETPGGGATFVVELPAAPLPAAPLPTAVVPHPAPEVDVTSGDG
jgi:two-component system OmpR family sensor kinase